MVRSLSIQNEECPCPTRRCATNGKDRYAIVRAAAEPSIRGEEATKRIAPAHRSITSSNRKGRLQASDSVAPQLCGVTKLIPIAQRQYTSQTSSKRKSTYWFYRTLTNTSRLR